MSKTEKQIDLTPFLCEAFASNSGVFKVIEKIYETNRVDYYQAAKASKWYNHEILTCQSISKEIVMKRALAILLEGNPDKLLLIIRKGWRSLYDYVKRQKTISIEHIYGFFGPKSKESLDRLTNDEVNAVGVIAFLLAKILNKTIDITPGYNDFMQNLFARLQIAKGVNAFNFKTFHSDDIKRVRKLKANIYDQAGINRFFSTFDDTCLKSMANILAALEFLYDLEGLSASIIEDEQLSENDIDEIIATYCYITQSEDAEEVANYLAYGYIIRALLRAYRRVKEQHFKTSRETLYLDLDTAQHEARTAREEAKDLQALLSQRDKEIRGLENRVKSEYTRAVTEYQGQLKAVKNKNEDLRQQLSQAQAEAQMLREALFSVPEPTPRIGTPIDLSIYRGVVVGGHERWQARMKEVLPDTWCIIHPDDNVDLNVIAGADIVFFFTGYLSHAVYYGVIGETRRRNIPVGYIKRINDVECLKEIQNEIKKRELMS